MAEPTFRAKGCRAVGLRTITITKNEMKYLKAIWQFCRFLFVPRFSHRNHG